MPERLLRLRFSGAGKGSGVKLYVGNVSAETSESHLRALFESFGRVTRVSMVTDPQSHRPRGFAYVEFADAAQARAALAGMNGREVHGQALAVSEAPADGSSSRRGFDGVREGGQGCDPGASPE